MIRLENISKQNGHQILFIEASAALQKGQKIGLVGPNGAGKTTLFRMITGQELPDEGLVGIDRGDIDIARICRSVVHISVRSVREVALGPHFFVNTALKYRDRDSHSIVVLA